jgi:hypothetical protein
MEAVGSLILLLAFWAIPALLLWWLFGLIGLLAAIGLLAVCLVAGLVLILWDLLTPPGPPRSTLPPR